MKIFLMIVTLRHNCSNMSWIEQNVKKLKTKQKKKQKFDL